MSDKPKILYGLTGSVAAIKSIEIIEYLSQFAEVTVIQTRNSKHFCDIPKDLNNVVKVYNDEDEWNTWKQRNDPVLHIELRKWADFFLIAPLDANTLAKLSGGICDNLITCVARAWDFEKPFVVAPAMNTAMWNHPVTSNQLSQLQTWGISIINPISKTLICGDSGIGAMEEPPRISDIMQKIMQSHI